MVWYVFFFFKQKTAYERRISDWSSDVCSSDLVGNSALPLAHALRLETIPVSRVENMCATGTEALRAAVYAVASGAIDFGLALGVEKLKDTGYGGLPLRRSEEHTSELQSLMRISYAVFCLKKKKKLTLNHIV